MYGDRIGKSRRSQLAITRPLRRAWIVLGVPRSSIRQRNGHVGARPGTCSACAAARSKRRRQPYRRQLLGASGRRPSRHSETYDRGARCQAPSRNDSAMSERARHRRRGRNRAKNRRSPDRRWLRRPMRPCEPWRLPVPLPRTRRSQVRCRRRERKAIGPSPVHALRGSLLQ